MKTTAKVLPSPDKKYPLLVKSKSSASIVLAYKSVKDDRFAGVVVHTPDGNNIGDSSEMYCNEAFEPFYGEITLKQ